LVHEEVHARSIHVKTMLTHYHNLFVFINRYLEYPTATQNGDEGD